LRCMTRWRSTRRARARAARFECRIATTTTRTLRFATALA
jgi:hypothetical protein